MGHGKHALTFNNLKIDQRIREEQWTNKLFSVSPLLVSMASPEFTTLTCFMHRLTDENVFCINKYNYLYLSIQGIVYNGTNKVQTRQK